MAVGASGTLLALLVTLCSPGCGFSAEKPLRTHNGKHTSVDKTLRPSWEPSIHLDGRPVDRFVISSSRPGRSHRFKKGDKDGRSPLLEDVDPEWVNLDGFAVLSGAPVNSAVPIRVPHSSVRNSSSVRRAVRVNRTVHPLGVSNTRTSSTRKLRRAPQSSSGPRQPERYVAGTPLLERRRYHHTKPQSDQRNRHAPKLTSESVHVVSLQAQKSPGQSASNRGAAAKASIPEPPEYEARDISVRVMSPKSVLISWVDPAVEMGKVEPGTSRSYTVRYREKGESARWEYKDSTQRRMMIEDLSADGMYEFSVRISQGDNDGKWSVSVFQRTPESAPSGPPENFEVKPLRGKGTAVIATWDPPEEPNGRIREYILSYAPAMKPFGMKSVTYSGRTTSATIDGLTPGDRYIFKIRATNRRGQGPQSKAFTVAMPGSSRSASSPSKTTEASRTTPAPSKQIPDQEESNIQSTLAPTKSTTTTQRPPSGSLNRRVRPLSQTRSYHSIFSSVRGSVRNGANRGSTRVKEETTTTTAPPVKETTTIKVVVKPKEPENDVTPDEEEEESRPLTTETPSLKKLTPSPTKQAPAPPKRQQKNKTIKIRIHQKPGSKSSSSPKSASSSDKLPSTTTISTPHIQESAAKRMDYTVTAYPESKKMFESPDSTKSKQSTSSLQETSVEPEKQKQTTPVSRATVTRTGGSGFGARYGFNRRNPGILFRGNSTRNGYKPGSTFSSHSNIPSRSQNQMSPNRHSSASTSQSSSRTGSRETSNTHTPTQTVSTSVFNRQETSDGLYSDTLAHTRSKSTGTTSNAHSTSTPQSSSQHLTHTNPLGNSQATSNVESDNTENSQQTSSGKDEENNDSTHKETERNEAKESGSSSKAQPAEREKTSPEKPPRTRISSSLLEKYPWLATRYPDRFASAPRTSSSQQDSRTPVTRTSSSIGTGRPILRGTPTRVSGATGADGPSTKQETRETNEEAKSLPRLDSLKNNVGTESLKPSVISQKEALSDTRQPATSTISSNSHSSGHRVSSETVHRGTVTDNESQEKNNFEENNEKNEATEGQKDTVLTSADSHKNTEDNESVETKEDSTNTRTSSSSGATSALRRPITGVNGRVRSPLLANRQFGSRFRPQPAQNSRLDSASESASSHLTRPVLTSVGSPNTVTRTGGLLGGTSQSTSSSSSSGRDGLRGQGGRFRNPIFRGTPNNGGGYKPANGNGKNGRPNLTATSDKDESHEASKSNGHRYITGPDGSKWLVDLERGILMNSEGQVLQDSQGKPKRVVLGEDGRTIFDHMGSPLVSPEGVALFGHGRDSRPVVNPKDKMLMVGGKPVLGLDVPKRRTTSSTTTTTTATTTTTTTLAPTTTTEAPTTEWTPPPFPTCPPGTYSKIDEHGYPEVDEEGILDCYPVEEESSGMETDQDLEKDELIPQTTLTPTTTPTVPTTEVAARPSGRGPSSEFDSSGKKRFTAPYVRYFQKHPGDPCSLTEALEFLQVDVLENLMEKDNNQNQPPKNKPHNLTVVAMEGCHSFIILDWARPLKDDMVSGYMVYSASYDDVLNNRWSSKSSSGTHLAIENLKPNSRYYFKVQAKNVFGLGPVSDTLTYVTESDDPLLIERPPGGEPIWIPFTFKYNSAHSSCKGSQYVKRTWYRKFVGVVLCNSLQYKIFMGDGLREPFYSIGDTVGQGEDHCQFVDSHRDGRTGPAYLSNNLPSAQGYYRAYRQEPVSFGVIGRRTNHPFVGWYECGVPIPGKW